MLSQPGVCKYVLCLYVMILVSSFSMVVELTGKTSYLTTTGGEVVSFFKLVLYY